MPYDIHNADGDMDRGKVNAELDKIIDDVPDEFDRHYDASVQVASIIRERLISLINQALDAAYAEGYSDCQDIA